MDKRLFLSGNEAVAIAAKDAGVSLGVGYPGTPSTEILENFAEFGGRAEWAPNEKVALEVAIGAAFCKSRVISTMKHVGLNVAADPLFTVAYSGTDGGLVVVVADDPGMASSQNEQDSRRYAVAAGVPILEPADSQEAYDFTIKAFELAEATRSLVLLRVTTRICHSKCIVERAENVSKEPKREFIKDTKNRVMIPAFARLAHKKMRQRLADIAAMNENSDFNKIIKADNNDLGIICSGISYNHCRDAAPEANILKIGLSYPLPIEKMRKFAESVKRCVIVEEGDPHLYEACKIADINVEGKDEMYRFGELDVNRVKRILANDTTPEEAPKPGKPPQLCVGCPHRISFEILRDLDCIISGDIGCYTLGVLPPFQAIDAVVCMGASIGMGVGMRAALPENEARRVVSVIGDSTFMHTGLNGITEMVYNRPSTGHLVIILDNATTAMTGLQENPATGRALNYTTASQIKIEDSVRGLGVDHCDVVDPVKDKAGLKSLIEKRLASNDLSVIIVRRPCILAIAKDRKMAEKNA